MTKTERQAYIAELQRRIAEIRSRLPKHTPSPGMLVELDELEDELARLDRSSHSHEAGLP